MDTVSSITVGIGVQPRTGVPDEGSQRAARQAAWVGARVGAPVTLLHAAWAEDRSGPVDPDPRTHAGLREIAAMVEADGADARIEVTHEYPWLALVKRALAGSTDLVVVGKRAAVERGRRRVGSTAVKVLRNSPVPVWLVKPDHDLAMRHVLVATDLSTVSAAAVQSAAWIAGRSEGELHVLHAWNLRPDEQRQASDMDEGEYAALVESKRAAHMVELEREVGGLAVDPTLHLQRGAAHTEILKEVEEEHPDLLVMGSLSRGGRPGFDVGTTAERVLEHVDVSLLVSKPNDFICAVQ